MDLPTTMCGVQLVGHGGPDKLIWNAAIPVPQPAPGEALVQVLAAGVNNTDINTRTGWYAKEVRAATDAAGAGEIESGGWAGALPFPLIQGGDLCGRVVAVGAAGDQGVLGRRVICQNVQPEPSTAEPLKMRVIGSEFDGAFAQFCAVPVHQLHDVTEAPLTDVELAALPCAFGTANGLVLRPGVSAGDRVLITGASGGVGMAAVMIAKLFGAHVTAQAAASKADAVRDAGADAILDRDAAPAPRSASVVIDVVGGPGFPALLEALIPGGRYAVAGAIAGPIVETDLRTVYLNDLTLFGCTFQPAAEFAQLVGHINAGRIRPLVSQTYPLDQIAQAQADFAAKRYPGKLVLIPPQLAQP